MQNVIFNERNFKIKYYIYLKRLKSKIILN